MKEVICILVIFSVTGVFMNPVMPVHHQSYNMPPFFGTSFEENKIEILQHVGKNKKHDTTIRCSLQAKTPKQSKLNSSKEDTTDNIEFQERPLSAVRSIRSRIDNIRKKSLKLTGKLQKTLPGTLRMISEEEKLTHQSSLMLQIQSNRSVNCLFLCPKAESFLPCTCDPCEKSINCSAISSFTELHHLFHSVSFPLTKFKKFILSSVPHHFAPHQTIFLDNMFGPVSFQEIYVENTAVEEVMIQAFTGSENTLEKISFTWNPQLRVFPFTQLINFQSLQLLEVTGGSLNAIPVFNRVPNLNVIFLNQNKITRTASMAFADLPQLMVLDMGYNNLEQIQENQFNFSAPDVAIYLDHNNIDYIDDRAFSSYQPGFLDVSNNDLYTLDKNVFQPILDLIIDNDYESYVNADKNPLCCNNILWLLSNPLYLLYMLLPDLNCSS
ncbi:uncharacterized protein [Panulirus ornatus]|uniref:uncharacterized protein n=1 Tax=Panulirus ornatus TaxID=150431 RepID=UPI003A8AD9FB